MSLPFISALLLGFGGSLHCLGMCGPIAMGLPFQKMSGAKKWSSILLFYLSKSLGYGMIGLIFGIFGKGIQLMNWQQNLSIIAGIILLLIACIPIVKNKLQIHLIPNKLYNTYFEKYFGKTELYSFAILGLLNAFLPCGLVYTALAGALVSATPFNGFVFMFLFGLGTAPALISLVIFKNKMSLNFRKYFNKSSLYISIFVGVLLIVRGMNLGIPYISPGFDKNKGKVHSCCERKH